MPTKKDRDRARRVAAMRRGEDVGEWRPKRFPGTDTPEQLLNAFKIVNEWANYLEAWNTSVRAAVGSLNTGRNRLKEDQIRKVMRKLLEGKHDFADYEKALNGAADVVGHPPGPPFQEPMV